MMVDLAIPLGDMGAAVAFEVTRQLERLAYPLPLLYIYSAHKAPHLVSEGAAIHRLSDGEMLAHIRQLGLVEKFCPVVIPQNTESRLYCGRFRILRNDKPSLDGQNLSG